MSADLEAEDWRALLGISGMVTLLLTVRRVVSSELSVIVATGFVAVTVLGAWCAYRHGQSWRSRFDV